MIGAGMTDFLIASVGASASFIGLLFVAISFITDKDPETSHEFTDKRLLAESAYAALLNIFFISIVALVPGANIAYFILAMALFGLISTIRMFNVSERKHRTNGTLFVSGILYVVEGLYGSYVLAQGGFVIDNYVVMTFFVFLFGVSIARAWEVTGIRHYRG